MTSQLTYPFANLPQPDSFIEVAPGIRWLRLPLPFKLDHINLWLLEDDGGWTLIDTGIFTQPTIALWEHHLKATLGGRPLRRVISTHFHPDHVGCAHWLVERTGAAFFMSRTEWLYARLVRSETAADAVQFWMRYYRAAGVDETTLAAIAERGEAYAKRVEPIPLLDGRLQAGDQIAIGGRKWQVVIGTGHSPELVCLYCPEAKLFISSDQVLPKISPNVGVLATEPESDPLTDFLASCRHLRIVDPGAFTLPMHGRPFYGVHDRLSELEEHHRQRLDDTLEACRPTPKTVVELLPVLFRRELDLQQMQFAVGEALAHTNYLVGRGKLELIRRAGEPHLFRTV